MPITASETDGRASVFTGADGKPTMPLLNADGRIPTGPGSAPSNQPVTIADGANVTLGAKADIAGANAGVAGQTAMSRLSGIWTVLGSLTDAAATAWDNTSNTLSALLRGIGGMINVRIPVKGQAAMAASTPVALASDQVSLPGAPLTTAQVLTVQQLQPKQFLSAIVHETGKTLNAEDVIGPLTTPLDAVITGVVPVAGQMFRVVQARLEIDSIVASVLAANIDVILYNDAAAVTPIAGNSQNSQLYVNGIKRMGRIQFGPFSTSGTGASTMSASFGAFQESKAAFMDCYPVANAISWRCVNKTTGTIFATAQNVRLLLSLSYP